MCRLHSLLISCTQQCYSKYSFCQECSRRHISAFIFCSVNTVCIQPCTTSLSISHWDGEQLHLCACVRQAVHKYTGSQHTRDPRRQGGIWVSVLSAVQAAAALGRPGTPSGLQHKLPPSGPGVPGPVRTTWGQVEGRGLASGSMPGDKGWIRTGILHQNNVRSCVSGSLFHVPENSSKSTLSKQTVCLQLISFWSTTQLLETSYSVGKGLDTPGATWINSMNKQTFQMRMCESGIKCNANKIE